MCCPLHDGLSEAPQRVPCMIAAVSISVNSMSMLGAFSPWNYCLQSSCLLQVCVLRHTLASKSLFQVSTTLWSYLCPIIAQSVEKSLRLQA